MPRHARKISPTRIYHVMVRGIEKKDIFTDNEDRYKFVTILAEKKKEDDFIVYAYCLMQNHVHLLINESSQRISRIMKCINVSYVKYFNRKYTRIGYLFQDRFKSEIIDTEQYLLEAVRYIHNNPVKANITRYPEEYTWSSYCRYIQEDANTDNLIDKDFVLDIFSLDRNKAVEAFKIFGMKETEHQFIEYTPKETDVKLINNVKDAQRYVEEFLKERGMVITDLQGRLWEERSEARRYLIKKLKRSSSLSQKQIAQILGISNATVNKIN